MHLHVIPLSLSGRVWPLRRNRARARAGARVSVRAQVRQGGAVDWDASTLLPATLQLPSSADVTRCSRWRGTRTATCRWWRSSGSSGSWAAAGANMATYRNVQMGIWLQLPCGGTAWIPLPVEGMRTPRGQGMGQRCGNAMPCNRSQIKRYITTTTCLFWHADMPVLSIIVHQMCIISAVCGQWHFTWDMTSCHNTWRHATVRRLTSRRPIADRPKTTSARMVHFNIIYPTIV